MVTAQLARRRGGAIPLIASIAAVVLLVGCSNEQGKDGSVIPNPVRTWGDISDENGPRNPIPFGQVARVEGWDVAVVGFGELRVDSLWQRPPLGYTFFRLEIEATRLDKEPLSPVFLAPGVLGVSNIERGLASDPVCFPRKAVTRPVRQSDQVRHSSCISIAVDDAAVFANDPSSLVVSLGLLDETWFALR